MGKIAQLFNVLPRRDFHDLSQSIYGTLTWGLLYPVYCRYFNAGDIVKIKPNFVLRTAPTVAPLFSPVEVRLHRFWCPLRLYHNAMRENSRSFDYTKSAHHILDTRVAFSNEVASHNFPSGTLIDWLSLLPNFAASTPTSHEGRFAPAAEPFIAYWDIVRNYYGFAKNNVFSYMSSFSPSSASQGSMEQRYQTLDILDDWVEGIYNSKQSVSIGMNAVPGYESISNWLPTFAPTDLLSKNLELLAVAPSNPDGLSRFVPNLSTDVITLNTPTTIPSLAVAAKAQSVKDILSAAGTRFTDYLYAFFKTSIPHSDIPSLLYSGKFWLNSSPLMQTSSGSSAGVGGGNLGSFVGQNSASAGLSSRRYKFDEPGYLMDIVSIRPVYAWAGAVPYYNIDVSGFYMFNPKFNQLGYRSVASREFGGSYFASDGAEVQTTYKIPFWNEFRSSFDQVHGRMRWKAFSSGPQNSEAYFVLQRSLGPDALGTTNTQFTLQFCDMANINNYFAVTSFDVDNTYMSSFYQVSVSSFVSKRFATDLIA